MIKQYDIVLVNLDPTRGSEIRKTRPCVIISPDEMNKYLRTVIIAPITSASKAYPTRVPVNQSSVSGWIVIDQIHNIDKSRIIKRLDALSPAEIKHVKAVIKEAFVD